MTRILVTGGSRCGKSTFAKTLDMPVRNVTSSDEFKSLGWSEASEHISTLFDEPGPWLMEGVALARGLRKWLLRHKHDASLKPCDKIYRFTVPKCPTLTGQESMNKGEAKVWSEIEPFLRHLGVEIVNEE